MEEEKKPIVELGVVDLINSLAVMKAKEAGLLGKTDLTAKEAGVLGAMMSDFQDTTARFEEKEISEEEAKNRYEDAFWRALESMFLFFYDVVTKSFILLLVRRIPVVAKVAEEGVQWARRHIVKQAVRKTVEVAQKGWNWLKEKICKVLA